MFEVGFLVEQGAGSGLEQGRVRASWRPGALVGSATGREGGREAGPAWQERRKEAGISILPFHTESLGRKIQIQRSGHLNLYLLLDSSQSVSENDFLIFKESASLMVDRVRNQEPACSRAFLRSLSLCLLPLLRTPLTAHLLLESFSDSTHAM